MTPLTLARNECSNFSDSRCMGIRIHDDLSQTVMTEYAGKACVLGEGQRCSFFEDTVLPMIDHIKSDPVKHKNYSHAKYLYFRTAAKKDGLKTGVAVDLAGLSEENVCPDCLQQPRPKGYSRCPACARKRRKELERERKRKSR